MSDNLLEVHIRHTLHTADGILPMEVDFALTGNSILALTGPSGAGKTTLLRQIAGLAMPESGRITFGKNPWLDTASRIHVPAQQRHIGFVFQDYALFPNMTVMQNLEFALPKIHNKELVSHLLEMAGLTQLTSRKPNQLSGGQQQRVALARALVREPELLLMDEPFAALDPEMQLQLQDLLLKLRREREFAVILVTHDMGEIFRLADQVAVMENGKLARPGTPAEVYLGDQTEELFVYGEVLACERRNETLSVQAWIDGKVRQFNLPTHWEAQLRPGATFTLYYNPDKADIRVINSNDR
ncbi:sulfate/molybdate ABC transporter ATP-binding protein [Dyadobacter sp.]|uniref:sulfate/molybdate ABC transporter ATP-binding protein n=1 Tax=Dyadobacter sp. TaxID=1914288 RepID=UPI0025B7DD22|nr:ATP-binding cassette domain-containing protein [Dyadobacter sp.]